MTKGPKVEDLKAMLQQLDNEATPLYGASLPKNNNTKNKNEFLFVTEPDDEDDVEIETDFLGKELENFIDNIKVLKKTNVYKLQQKTYVDETDDVNVKSKQTSTEKSSEWRNIIKFQKLSKISEEITKRANRTKIGTPTAIKVTGKEIAVGSSLGIIIIFNYEQQIRTILGSVTGTIFSKFNFCYRR